MRDRVAPPERESGLRSCVDCSHLLERAAELRRELLRLGALVRVALGGGPLQIIFWNDWSCAIASLLRGGFRLAYAAPRLKNANSGRPRCTGRTPSSPTRTR